MPASPRYRVGGDNSELRHVLRAAWKTRCYWCKQYKDYLDLEIDHVVPRSANKDRLLRISNALDLSADFDVHAAYNLAPICSNCNDEKSDLDLADTPLVLTKLRQAKKLEPEVARRYDRLHKATGLSEALITAANADLGDPEMRATFEENAPAVARRLAELDPKLLEITRSEVVLVENEARDLGLFVDIELAKSGHEVLDLLAGLTGKAYGWSLREPIDALIARLADLAEGALRNAGDGEGSPDAGLAEVDLYHLALTEAAVAADSSGRLIFEFGGEFEMAASASVVRSSSDGGETEDLQGDVSALGRFRFGLIWEGGVLEFDQVWLEYEESDIDTAIF